MTIFKQSPYLAAKRFTEAFILSFLAFVVVSAAFYKNVLIVCRGELLTGVLFALGVAVFTTALLFFPMGQEFAVKEGESLCVVRSVAQARSSLFYEKSDLIRASRTSTPFTRLFGASKIELVFRNQIHVLYLKNKDLPSLDFFFAQPVSETGRKEEKENAPNDALFVRPHYANALFKGIRVAVYAVLLTVALLPVTAGVLSANHVTLASFLPNATFVIRILVIFILCIAASVALGAIVAIGNLLYLATTNANYRLSVKDDSLYVRKGRLVTRAHLLFRNNLRLMRESAPVFSAFGKNKTVTLFFAEGKRRFSLIFGGQATTEEERAKLAELFPAFTHAECKPQNAKRFLPKLCSFAVAAYVPIVLFSFLITPMVAYLALPVSLLFYARCKNWSFAENQSCITVQSGALTVSRVSARKETVSAVRIHKAPIARAFGVFNAEICLLSTEMSLSIPSLSKKECDIAVNLIKTVKNN